MQASMAKIILGPADWRRADIASSNRSAGDQCPSAYAKARGYLAYPSAAVAGVTPGSGMVVWAPCKTPSTAVRTAISQGSGEFPGPDWPSQGPF
jgi:hypothetical protein